MKYLNRRGGALTIDGPDGRTVVDTFTCAHCQTIVQLTQASSHHGIIGRDNFDQVGATCGCCGQAVCLKCSFTNDPWLNQLDRIEEAAYRKQQNAKVMGG